MHPQAAFLEYANVLDALPSPARQRPDLAVVCAAGLAARHDVEPEYGIELGDLDPNHSLTRDPPGGSPRRPYPNPAGSAEMSCTNRSRVS